MKIWIGNRFIDSSYFRTWRLVEDLQLVYFIYQHNGSYDEEFSLPLIFSTSEEARRFYDETWNGITDGAEAVWCLDEKVTFCWKLYFKIHSQKLRERRHRRAPMKDQQGAVTSENDTAEASKEPEDAPRKGWLQRLLRITVQTGNVLSILVLIPLLAVSCIYEYPVTDSSFEFAAQVTFDQENDVHRLTLTKISGCSQEEYTIGFSLDAEATVTLTDKDGREHDSPFAESFSQIFVRTYILSPMPLGEHILKLVISTDCYRQEIEVPYTVTSVPFTIHSEVSTSSQDGTILLLSLSEGISSTPYEVTVQVDGMAVDEMNPVMADFSTTPIVTLLLPLQRPGRHDVSITSTDGQTRHSSSVSYTEPARHPWVDITLRHDDNSGRHVAVVGANPYGIELSFDTSLTITGRSTFCTSTLEYHYNDIMYSSKVKSISDSRCCLDAYDGETVNLIDRDALAARITESYEMSNIMTYFPAQGDGESTGHEEYRCTGTERAYYSIIQEDLSLKVTAEKVAGVTLRVRNDIGQMSLNGKTSSSGTTHIAL